ncbi:MAG TPA: 4-(cytidine 5'-diphospho)-2-C-methyl-D-erythritol kinase [Steroidobacteraceae bacterium]|jgi:4-diphosphocytidyl-2-C-methyl-D-erythritol kinase|nr:4-(cytidine 5'-diphospho)-2-C-methyl-D-erythritol kinase [Steroidobacteraceae bacterium]
MSGATRWPAPAKLNLFLHITGRRSDGYHDLQTLFQLIDLADDIHIQIRPDGLIERPTGPQGVPAESDLVVRAARALQAATGNRLGATLSVTKRIPLGGGLGGGSSDAATALVALNRMWECGLNDDELADIGVELGADVPVFVRGHSAWAEGRGERLTPLALPPSWFALVHPQVHVPTAAVFQAPELTRNSPPITMGGFLQSGGRNDFEPVVRARYPEVARALDWLGHFAPARLTGTGACIFAPCAAQDEAQDIVTRVPAPWRGMVARGMNVSPLLAMRA